jgi:hypothetical protein
VIVRICLCVLVVVVVVAVLLLIARGRRGFYASIYRRGWFVFGQRVDQLKTI